MLLMIGEKMKKHLLIKLIIIYLPFLLGIGMFSFGYINLFSSLLLFLGGYISIKNTVDYRKIKRNINNIQKRIEKEPIAVKVKKIDNNKDKCYVRPIVAEDIVGFKRTRRYSRVRRIR